MIANLIAITGVLLTIIGIAKRRVSWARYLILAGVGLLCVAFVVGGGIEGIRAGWRAYSR
jgi:hypothetical protein